MKNGNTLNQTNEFANSYDNYIADKNWAGPQLIFDLLKPFIKKDDLLLDLGIGTGLASIPFKKECLKIYGIDGSDEMISVCKSKEFADGLFLSDLSAEDFYFPNIEFDHIISNAFFHFIPNPEKLLFKISEKIKTGGYFCFTTLISGLGKEAAFAETNIEGISYWTNPENGLLIYKQSENYIKEILKNNGLRFISNQTFIGLNDATENKQVYFNAYLSQKIK